jgi:hypothetical protein
MTILKVVYFDIKESTSLNILSVLFEAIELNEAIKKDALTWLKAIDQELKSLKRNNIFVIIKGIVLNNYKVINY